MITDKAFEWLKSQNIGDPNDEIAQLGNQVVQSENRLKLRDNDRYVLTVQKKSEESAFVEN